MPDLRVKVTKFANTPEAWEVFHQRGWERIIDQSKIPEKRKLVNKERHSTSLMDLDIEEWEYGG